MENNTLKHYGILGMRWGVRRYQNPDGTLTDAGKKRYGIDDDKDTLQGKQQSSNQEKIKKEYKKQSNNIGNDEQAFSREFEKTPEYKKLREEYDKAYDKYYDMDFLQASNRDWEEAEKAFSKAEEKLLRATREYSGKKLVKKYGNDLISAYANSGRFNAYVDEGKDAVEEMSDMWWIYAE